MSREAREQLIALSTVAFITQLLLQVRDENDFVAEEFSGGTRESKWVTVCSSAPRNTSLRLTAVRCSIGRWVVVTVSIEGHFDTGLS